jgi:acetylglutamate kinase
MPTYTTPPSEEDIHALAEAAFADLPPRLAAHVQNVAILVENLADDATLEEMGIETPWELTGLYRGVPLPNRSVTDAMPLPDTIYLYREAILLEWVETGEDLQRLVASVLIHEIAHHFGFSDADIERLEAEIS